jgi:hypothetical protein
MNNTAVNPERLRIGFLGGGLLGKDMRNAFQKYTNHEATYIREGLGVPDREFDIVHLFEYLKLPFSMKLMCKKRILTLLMSNYQFYWKQLDLVSRVDATMQPCLQGSYYQSQSIMQRFPHGGPIPKKLVAIPWKTFPLIHPLPDTLSKEKHDCPGLTRPLALWAKTPRIWRPTQAILAWKEVVREFPQATLLICGQTIGRDFVGIARDHGIEDRVVFYPYQERKEFYELVRAADVLLIPTRKGGGTVAGCVGARMGRIVVYTGHNGAPHYRHMETGYQSADDWYVLSKDLKYIFSHLEELESTVGARAADEFKHMSESSCAKVMDSSYKELLDLLPAGTTQDLYASMTVHGRPEVWQD